MTCDCAFSIDYRLGESIAFVVDILIWNEETSAYDPVGSLADWSGKYILKQGDTVLQFETPDSQIERLDSQFVVNVPPDDLTDLETGKVEHEFVTTDDGGIVRVIFSHHFTAKNSLLWETSQ
jgi:hypothetical protein